MACGRTHQLDRRCVDYLASVARFVEVEAGYKAKACPERYIFAGHLVSCPTTLKNWLIHCSIIAVTGVRIKVILEFDPRDASYGLGPITFWSILEPLLGVINCCLPVIQPAISALTGQRLWSKGGKLGPNIPYKWSGSSKHNGNKSRRMGPLDPMGKLSSTTDAESQDALYENHIRGSTHATHIGLGQIKQEKTVLETSKAIMVEQQWEVS